MPRDDKNPTVDDGIRGSGRVRKTRYWDGESYGVRPSSQERILDREPWFVACLPIRFRALHLTKLLSVLPDGLQL